VNIRYKPATGNAREEVELPLKLLMLGDYTLKADETPIEDRKLSDINKDNFNDVMRSHDLSVDMNVDNKLEETEGAEPEQMPVSLKFETLKDFEPENVARQVPELNRLLELREALVALKGPLGNVPAFRKMIQGMLDDSDQREKLLSELTAVTEAKRDEGGEPQA
tara:strand:- start:1648 stop:2142 length:495 start_codon:yes stop_codon:yes gene_type:complete